MAAQFGMQLCLKGYVYHALLLMLIQKVISGYRMSTYHPAVKSICRIYEYWVSFNAQLPVSRCMMIGRTIALLKSRCIVLTMTRTRMCLASAL